METFAAIVIVLVLVLVIFVAFIVVPALIFVIMYYLDRRPLRSS
jgi:hypothetical protein